jgi:predicted  nucleic acid-binding Zn-ribbon protein
MGRAHAIRDDDAKVCREAHLLFFGAHRRRKMTHGRLERLLAVQALDIELAALETRREEVPRRRAEMTREITALEQERSQREEARERARISRRGKEGDLGLVRERLAKYERQLNEVKTNVAYSALLSEIQRSKREIGQLEDEILDLMAEREEHDGRITALDAELGEKRGATAAALEALTAEEAEIDREVAHARERRERIAAEVEPGVYRMYDRLRRARRFPALVPLRGRACGSCHSALPPQVLREITHEGALHVCEACGVLVYAASEPAPAGADRG